MYVRFHVSDLPADLRVKAAVAISDGLVRELKRDMLDGYVPNAVKYDALLEAVFAMRAAILPSARREFMVDAEDWLEIVGPLPGAEAAA